MADSLKQSERTTLSRRLFLRQAATVASAPAWLALLAACTPSAVAPSASASATAAAKGTEGITFWHTFGGALGKKLEAFVDDYNASQQNVKVTYQFAAPSYVELLQKLLPAIAAGTGPDAVLTLGVQELAKSGALLRLDDLLAKNKVDLADFNQGLMADTKYQGGIYALPFARSTPILFYNQELMDTAGLDGKAFLSSWDNIATQGAKLVVKKGTETAQFAYANPLDWWFWAQLVFAFGGEFSDPSGKVLFNQGPAVDALQFWQDLVFKSGVATAYPAGSGFDSWNSAMTDWVNKRVTAIAQSTAALTSNLEASKFKAGAAAMPGMKTRAVPTGGSNLMLLAKSQHPDAAMQFIISATSVEGTSAWHIASGYLPVRTSAQNSQKLQDWLKKSPNHGIAIEQLKVARPTPVITQMSKFDTQVMRPLLERVLLQKADVKSELDKAAKLTDTLWADYSK